MPNPDPPETEEHAAVGPFGEDTWDECFQFPRCYIDSTRLPDSIAQRSTHISAYPPEGDPCFGARIEYFEHEDKPIHSEHKTFVRIFTPLRHFWAQNRKGPAKKFFTDTGTPGIEVAIFYALETGLKNDNILPYQLLGKLDRKYLNNPDGSRANLGRDSQHFDYAVSRWLLDQARESDGLERLKSAQEIARKKIKSGQPRFWTHQSSNKSSSNYYQADEILFFRAIRRAALTAGGVPTMMDVRKKYQRFTTHLQGKKQKTIWDNSKLSETEAAKLGVNDLKFSSAQTITPFDKVMNRLGFDWLPKGNQMAQEKNLRFCRTK